MAVRLILHLLCLLLLFIIGIVLIIFGTIYRNTLCSANSLSSISTLMIVGGGLRLVAIPLLIIHRCLIFRNPENSPFKYGKESQI